MDRCDACDFTYARVRLPTVGRELRALPDRYAEALRAADADGVARTRPAPETWSPLEYTCHFRDVLRIQRERLELALEQPCPEFATMRRDERAVEERYNEQDIDVVLTELREAAEALAEALDGLDTEQWFRTGLYPALDPAERTMGWLARHTLHEGIHHLDDLRDGAAAVRGSA